MTNTPEDSDKQQLTLVENRKIQQNALLKIQKYQNKQKYCFLELIKLTRTQTMLQPLTHKDNLKTGVLLAMSCNYHPSAFK